MSFPITHVKGSNIEVTDAHRTLIEQKLSSLDKFIGTESDVSCDVELEKITGKQSGDIYRAEANLHLKGKLYRGEATMDQIEKSIDEVRAQLNKELRRDQDKRQTLIKRGGAAIKKMMRFGQ